MKLVEFNEKYNELPESLECFANGASDVEDCAELQEAAKNFLKASALFETLLEKYDIFIG